MAGLNIRAVITGMSVAGEVTALTLGPDYADDRNQEWARNTPSFATQVAVVNELAEELEVGQEVEVTLVPGRKAADRQRVDNDRDDSDA
jgi:hypothetical protein